MVTIISMEADLGRISLFAHQPDQLLQKIGQLARMKRFEKGEAIIWQDDPSRAVYFILEGKVEIFRIAHGGREQIISRLSVGEGFNIAPICLDDAGNPANARAINDTDLLILRKEDFVSLLKSDATFFFQVLRYVSKRLLFMTEMVETLSLFSVKQRLARFLIEQADAQTGLETWTQGDIARSLGTVREVVARMLKEFEREGLISIERNRIQLADRKMLEDVIEKCG